MNFKLIGLIFIAIGFAYNILLQVVKYLSKNNPIPENVKDIYDAESYQKWLAYHNETSLLHIIWQSAELIVYMLMIGLNVYPIAAELFPNNDYLSMIAVLILCLFVDGIVDTAFSYIYTMKIDEKYGFNKTTVKTFIADRIKSFIISSLIMIGLVSAFIAIYSAMGDWILVLFSGIMIAFLFIMLFVYPIVSKIYNKFTPLEDGELRQKLTALLEKNGYHVKEIQVMDASKRTTKSNAYFSGYGKTKTIVLFDTLIESSTPDEIVAIFAHELGHGLHKDVVKNSFVSILQMVTLVVLAWLTVRTGAIYPDFGFAKLNYGFALILVMAAEFPIIAPLFMLVSSAISRKAEYRADAHAVKEGYGEALITALKNLVRQDLDNLSPSKIEVVLTYSHPPMSQRIAAIEKEMGK